MRKTEKEFFEKCAREKEVQAELSSLECKIFREAAINGTENNPRLTDLMNRYNMLVKSLWNRDKW